MENIIIWQYIIAIIAICAVSYAVHNSIEKIKLKKHKKKQTRRYLIAALIAILPVAITQQPLNSPVLIFNAITALICAFSSPIMHYISKKQKKGTGKGLRMDIVAGIYLFGWLSAIHIAISSASATVYNILCPVTGVAVFALFMFAVIQWGYFFIYGINFDSNGMEAALNTDKNEAIEYLKSFPIHILILIPLAFLMLLGIAVWDCSLTASNVPMSLYKVIFLVVYIIGMSINLFRKKRGIFMRTHLLNLYYDIKDYSRRTSLYTEGLQKRLAGLNVEIKGKKNDKPHTYIMIIGESASRDYMSAYVDMEYDTTPWLREQKKDTAHNVIFSNAYSCHHQTVPTLERVLTERNQYNTKEFYESTSIIDIARKAGYTTYWYSNQGFLGSHDTSITLVADTCDTAKWTEQSINKGRYDGDLLNFLDEVDPTKNNFVILHFMGSHANYLSRYPASATQWGEPGVENLMLNYYNSLHYTDSVLKEIYNYGREKLNLEAMIYFSDHGCVPNERRKSYFTGFGTVRIPLSIHFTDSYISHHKERFEAFKANKDKYFTNDLTYEMVCAMFDIESNNFNPSNSIGHSEYKYTKEMLKTDCGAIPLTDEDKL